jgi:hypothetical protein
MAAALVIAAAALVSSILDEVGEPGALRKNFPGYKKLIGTDRNSQSG